MKTKGIEISDENDNVLSVRLEDILDEIREGKNFYWSILFFDGSGHLPNGKTIPNFIKEVNHSEKGIFINWEDLNFLATFFYQIIDILIVGCKKKDAIARYNTDQEMYESCEFVLRLMDSGYWEVFSFDFDFIDRLALKFKETKFLNSDFQNKWTNIPFSS